MRISTRLGNVAEGERAPRNNEVECLIKISDKSDGQCIGFYDYLGFGQIMKNKKYFKSKSNPNLKNSINFKSNHLKNVSNPNHFLKKPNPNQIQIKSNPKNNEKCLFKIF